MVLPVVAGAFIVVVIALQAVVMSRLAPAPAAPRQDRAVTVVAPGVSAPATDPVGRLVELLRHRRWLRRGISLASLGAMGTALWLIGYPFYTNVMQGRIQNRLDKELASGELRQAYQCTAEQALGCDGLQEGDSLTRLRIPKLKVDVVVVEGVGANALRAGAGHYPTTAMPCAAGNAAIAGHRTTYGRPFNNVDLLRPGDRITLETPVDSCTYEVRENPKITAPNATWVLDRPADPNVRALTLTTCHPKGSAKQRLIIFASLVEHQPSAG